MKTYQHVITAIFFVATMALLWRVSVLEEKADKAEADKWWCEQNLDLLENNNRDLVLELWRSHRTIDSLEHVVHTLGSTATLGDTLYQSGLFEMIIDSLLDDSTVLDKYRLNLHQSVECY